MSQTSDQPLIMSLAGDAWSVALEQEHPASRGVTGDRSEVPEGLVGREVSATVPGCVHTDLLAAQIIPDPYLADNEKKLYWIGRCGWTYRTQFDAADLLERRYVELCFDGLDTVATVTLNGQRVASTRNMHRRYRFDVKASLKPTGNELVVTFAAPLPTAWDEQDRLGELPRAGSGSNPSLPHNFLRKMSCNFGWDWGPIVPTCGIWRNVRLEAWDTARLGDVRPIIRTCTAKEAAVEIAADVNGQGDIVATLTAPDGQTFTAEKNVITVPAPKRWWPVGHGEQPLYTLKVELKSGETVVDQRTQRIGLRSVAVDTSADNPQPADELGEGTTMRLLVNGEPVYCKGTNWIPDDCFPHRVDRTRYADRIDKALAANMNMLRVWGGGLYEADEFYELCTQRGMMVWQDFLTACAAYSEDDDTKTEIDAEARDNVSRLMGHTSLMLLNGCNENLWGWHDWSYGGKSWPEFIGDRGWGLHYYFHTFPEAVAELAPTTPYWPGSPSNGGDESHFHEGPYPNANEHGNRHVWNVWHGPGHYANYFGHYPRFCSEFGFHGQATWPPIEQAIPESQRAWDSDQMRDHNKNGLDKKIPGRGDGQDKAQVRMSEDFNVPADDFDTWLYLSQVLQARALTVGVGWYRSLHPWNHGALIWQLNDCWPCASWSIIDVDTHGIARPKPSFFAGKRFFAPRVVNLGPRKPTQLGGWEQDPGPLRAYLHNDHAEPWHTTLRLRLMGYDGTVHAEHETPLQIAPRSAARIDVPDTFERGVDRFVIAEADGGERAYWWFAPDKDAPMPTPQFDASYDGRALTVTARTMLRDVSVFPERLNEQATADDACVTLLPGESHTFEITSPQALDEAELIKPPVLRCVGDR